MVKQVGKERRSSVRAKRIMSIQHRVYDKKVKTQAPWSLSTTQDMSVSGLSFLSDKAYTTGDMLEVRVVMSGVLDIFDGFAKVVRLERKKAAAFYKVAIRFAGKTKNRKAKVYTGRATKRVAVK